MAIEILKPSAIVSYSNVTNADINVIRDSVDNPDGNTINASNSDVGTIRLKFDSPSRQLIGNQNIRLRFTDPNNAGVQVKLIENGSIIDVGNTDSDGVSSTRPSDIVYAGGSVATDYIFPADLILDKTTANLEVEVVLLYGGAHAFDAIEWVATVEEDNRTYDTKLVNNLIYADQSFASTPDNLMSINSLTIAHNGFSSLPLRVKIDFAPIPPDRLLKGLQVIRSIITSGSNGADTELTLREGNNIISSITYYQPLPSPLNKTYILTFHANELTDKTGSNLTFEIKTSTSEVNKGGSIVYAGGAVDYIELQAQTGALSVVAPDVPMDLVPEDGVTNGSTTMFSATLNDADDPSLGDVVNLVIEYSQDQTFASGVTEVVSNPVSPSNTATVSSSPMVNGTWYWRAKARDMVGLESPYTAVRTITVFNALPNIPTLIYPSNGTVTSEEPVFAGEVKDTDGGTLKLEVDYSTSSSFSTKTTLQSEATLSGKIATVSPSSSLADGTLYYWRARTFDGVSYSDYSPTMTINVDNKPPLAPTISVPGNNSIYAISNINLVVDAINPTGETLVVSYEVSKSTNFIELTAGGTINNPTGARFTTALSIQQQGNYYVRAKTVDSLGKSSLWTPPSPFFVDIPTRFAISPDAILSQTNLTGTLSSITDDPDVAGSDSGWLTASTDANTAVRVSFPTPVATLKTGANLQSFKVKVRTTVTGASPTVTVRLYENGTLKGSGTTTSVTSTTSQLVTYSFDSSLLSNLSGANVECHVDGTYSRNGGSRAKIEVSAIEWEYESVGETQVTAPADTTAPSSVSSLSASTTSSSAIITWNNPSELDFSHVEIYKDNALVKDHHQYPSYLDTGLASGMLYNYKVIAVDTSGNKSTQATVGANTVTEATPKPTVTIVSLNRNKISNVQGMETATLKFKFDVDVISWTVNVMGTDHTTGTVADSGGAVTAGTEITAVIDYYELYQEGVNRVNIYGQSTAGWTPYGG